MVRSNTPLPFLFRWRAGASAHRQVMPDQGIKPLAPLPAGRLGARRASSAQIVASFAVWRQFVRQYMDFTDLLCVAAKNGCDEQLEGQYTLLRWWLKEHYYRMAPMLQPYLKADGASVDADQQEADFFESLFLRATLSDLLESDGGCLIEQVTRISDAIYRCDEQFCQEAHRPL